MDGTSWTWIKFEENGRLVLGKNLVLLQYEHFSKVQEEISVFCGYFW